VRTVDIEEARAVHSRILVFDGHNDTPVERVHRGEAPLNWMQRDPAYHMDVPRMREGGFDGGFFIVGNGPTADVMYTLERTLQQIDAYPDALRLILSSRPMPAYNPQRGPASPRITSIPASQAHTDFPADGVQQLHPQTHPLSRNFLDEVGDVSHSPSTVFHGQIRTAALGDRLLSGDLLLEFWPVQETFDRNGLEVEMGRNFGDATPGIPEIHHDHQGDFPLGGG
jgi:hypothetical protein